MGNTCKEKIVWDGIHVGYRLYRKGCYGLKRFIGYDWIEDNVAYYRMFIAKRISV